jgi:hypothetical protein
MLREYTEQAMPRVLAARHAVETAARSWNPLSRWKAQRELDRLAREV